MDASDNEKHVDESLEHILIEKGSATSKESYVTVPSQKSQNKTNSRVIDGESPTVGSVVDQLLDRKQSAMDADELHATERQKSEEEQSIKENVDSNDICENTSSIPDKKSNSLSLIKPGPLAYFYSNEEDDLSLDSPSLNEEKHGNDNEDNDGVGDSLSVDTTSKGGLIGELEFENTDDEFSSESPGKLREKSLAREQLIENYKQALMEHKSAKEINIQLQTKLAEYFRRKKADAAEQSATSSAGGSNTDAVIDYELRYQKYITSLTELRRQYQTMQASYQKQIEDLSNTCTARQEEVDAAYKEFSTYKYNIGKKAVHSRTGRSINPKELVAMLAAEQKKEATVMEVRLENIKLRNELAKVEVALKSKEELAEGLHLIDYEQLKIENQTYNEKIEERNEELSKLRRKISNTVQIMTHVKEKLQAIQYEKSQQRERLGVADGQLSINRDRLNKLKQTRDHLRSENAKLKRSCGLLGKNVLLLNFEDVVDAVNDKTKVLENTKRLTNQYRVKSKEFNSQMGGEFRQ